jgi:mono/diheme cytochrome c family protein
MRTSRFIVAVVAAALAGAPALAAAQQKADLGKREYESNCASCHGLQGKGDGPMSDWSEVGVSNLTLLAKRNNGVFPFVRVYEFIDGTQVVKAHGPREMPIWGADYKIEGAEYHMLLLPYDPEVYVRTRILALVEYMYRLQVK